MSNEVNWHLFHKVNLTHKGLRAARLKAIFVLPERLSTSQTRLVYVEWFRPFREKDSDTGLHILMRSTHQGGTNAEVIPLSRVMQSLHLVPRFGAEKPARWSKWNVFDECQKFFVNKWVNFHTYQLFRKTGA